MLPLAGLLAALACGGDASSPPAIASPDAVEFGEVDVGGSTARGVTLTNTSGAPLDIIDVITSGVGVTASGRALPFKLAPGETMDLSLELAPTTSGDVSGSVSFLSASGAESLAQIRTVGKGVRPNTLLAPDPTAVGFDDVTVGARATKSVTLTNNASQNLRVTSLSASAAGVTVTGLPLPSTFAPGESATLEVAFAPVVAGAVTGSVSLKSEQGRALAVVDISGTAVSPAAPVTLTATPSRLDFGNVTVGNFSAQGVTLTNTSSQAVTVSEIATTGAGFSGSGLVLPTTIAPGASASVSVKFTPSTTSSATGQLVVRAAGAVEPLAVVELAGSGVAAASITSVTVRDATVEAGKTVQMQADVVAVGTIDKSVTWSVDSGSIGTVDAKSGVYTAPAVPGTYRVSATSNADSSKQGAGSVTVTAPPPPPPPTEPAPTPTLPPGVVPAFAGAEGAGALAKGGRGGAVYEVTSLADTETAGTLRYCISRTGPRTCVFRVSGTIELTRPLGIFNPYLTVAGQTAPGGGIQLSGRNTTSDNLISVWTHDVVWRYTRVRMGYNANRPANSGVGIGIYHSAYNVIFDHNSVSWANDDMMNVFSNVAGQAPRDVTLSWNLIGEPLKAQSTPLSSGGSTHSACDVMTNIDYHNNFLTTFNHRGALVGHRSGRYVNNITYNWAYWAVTTEAGVEVDFIGNLWKSGPLYPSGFNREIHVYPRNDLGGPTGNPSLYVLGNKGPNNSDPARDNWAAMVQQIDYMYNGREIGVPSTSYRRTTPLASAGVPITVTSVSDLESRVLPEAGASRRLDCAGNWVANRDAADARMVNDYQAGTGFIPVTERDVGGFPSLAAGTACADSDHDGMPDVWEAAQGLRPNDAADRNAVASGSIFTNLDRYLAGN